MDRCGVVEWMRERNLDWYWEKEMDCIPEGQQKEWKQATSGNRSLGGGDTPECTRDQEGKVLSGHEGRDLR